MDPAAMIAENTTPRSPAAPQPEPDYPDSQVEFALPQDFTPPDDAKPGDPFQALGTFRIKDDKTMCLLAVDGTPVTPTEEEQAEPTDAVDAISKGLPATGLPA